MDETELEQLIQAMKVTEPSVQRTQVVYDGYFKPRWWQRRRISRIPSGAVHYGGKVDITRKNRFGDLDKVIDDLARQYKDQSE